MNQNPELNQPTDSELFSRWAPDGTFSLGEPPASTLMQLEQMAFSTEDLRALLGESPAMGVSDIRENVISFWNGLRGRTAGVICEDDKLKDYVGKSVEVGAGAVWLSLLSALGVGVGTLAATALQPLAVGLVKDGLSSFCED